MTADDSTEVTVTRGMLRRWAEVLDRYKGATAPVAGDVVADAIRAVLADQDVPERTRRAEERREMRRLLDASSLGTPGAVAMRKRGGGEELTADEEAAANAELRDLERSFAPRRRPADTSPDPEGAEAAVLAPDSPTAQEQQ